MALFVVFAFTFVEIGFVVLSILTIMLILAGYLVVPSMKPSFDVLIQPNVTEQGSKNAPIVIQGKEIGSTSPVRLAFEVQPANRAIVIAIALMASAGLYGFLRNHSLSGYYDPNTTFGVMLWALEYLTGDLLLWRSFGFRSAC